MSRILSSIPNGSILLADFTDGSIPASEIITDSGFPAANGRTYSYDSRGVQMAFTGGTTAQYASFKWEPHQGTPGTTIDLSGTEYLAVEVEVPDGTGAIYDTFIIYVVEPTGTSYATYQSKTYLSGADKTPRRQIITALMNTDAWTRVGTISNWSAIGKIEFRFGIHASAQNIPANIFVRKIWKGKNRAKVMITFDDSMDGQINYAYPSLQAAGFKATIFSSPSQIGNAGRLTTSDYTTLYNAGWDMGVQQYNDSADIPVNYTGSSGLTSDGLGTATWTNVSSIAHGLSTGDVITVTGAMSPSYNGTFTITKTGASTFTYDITGTPLSPDPGQPVCRRLPVETIKRSFQLSQEYLRSHGWTRGNNFAAYSNGVTSPTVERILESIGIVMARTTRTNAQAGMDPRCRDSEAMLRLSGQTMDQQTATTILGVVDDAIKRGRSVILYGHDIDPTPASLTITQSEWDLIIAGLTLRSDQGLIDVVTCSEFYNHINGNKINA